MRKRRYSVVASVLLTAPLLAADCGEVIVSAWKICGERKALRPLMTGVARRGEDSAQLDRK